MTLVLIGSRIAQYLSEPNSNYGLVISAFNWAFLAIWLLLVLLNRIRAPVNNNYLYRDYCIKYGTYELYLILPLLMVFLQLGRLVINVDSM